MNRRHDQRDVGGGRLVEQVEHDRDEQSADGDVGCRGMEGMAEPRPLNRSLTGPIGRNNAASQRWLKSPRGLDQAAWASTIRRNKRPNKTDTSLV